MFQTTCLKSLRKKSLDNFFFFNFYNIKSDNHTLKIFIKKLLNFEYCFSNQILIKSSVLSDLRDILH